MLLLSWVNYTASFVGTFETRITKKLKLLNFHNQQHCGHVDMAQELRAPVIEAPAVPLQTINQTKQSLVRAITTGKNSCKAKSQAGPKNLKISHLQSYFP